MDRSELDGLAPGALVCVAVYDVRKMLQVMDQLFREERLDGDRQRDLAQMLQMVLKHTEPLPEE